jgi:hypothetical protein
VLVARQSEVAQPEAVAAFEIFSLRRREANGLRMPEERPRPTRARLGRLFERLRWGTPLPDQRIAGLFQKVFKQRPRSRSLFRIGAAHWWHGPGEPLQALVIEEREPAGVEAVLAVFEARDRLLSRQSLQRELRRALPVTQGVTQPDVGRQRVRLQQPHQYLDRPSRP